MKDFSKMEEKISKLLYSGASINVIVRKLNLTQAVRRWLRINRPGLYEIAIKNGAEIQNNTYITRKF